MERHHRDHAELPTTWNLNHKKRESTHGFLREYAALQQRMFDEFANGKGFIYMVAEHTACKILGKRPFEAMKTPPIEPGSSLNISEKFTDHLRTEQTSSSDTFDRYIVAKTKVDFVRKTLRAHQQ